MKEHEAGSMTDQTKYMMVRIIVNQLRKEFGKNPSKAAYEGTAEAIISYFPYLRNPTSVTGYVRLSTC